MKVQTDAKKLMKKDLFKGKTPVSIKLKRPTWRGFGVSGLPCYSQEMEKNEQNPSKKNKMLMAIISVKPGTV